MGIGPKGDGLRERVGVRLLESLDADELVAQVTKLQEDRTLARALAQQKKREAMKPKVKRGAKIKIHKRHCMHTVQEIEVCCKCEKFLCSKPKKERKKRVTKDKEGVLNDTTHVTEVAGSE
jgi:hypothetical protein